MAFTIAYESDWETRLLSKLYIQFKEQPNIVALVKAVIAPQFQDLEESGQSILTITSIDDSEGVNLDVIGRIVQQLRLGTDDATYRHYLRARIRANKSSGTPNNIYSVFFALIGDNTVMKITQYNIAFFQLVIGTPISHTLAGVALGFLRDSKMAGVGANLLWQEEPDEQMFTFANACFITAPATAGDNSLTVDTTATFPAYPTAGIIIIDQGTPVEEEVNFTVSGPTTLAIDPLANNHSVGAAVTLEGDVGLGFPYAENFVRIQNIVGATTLAVTSFFGNSSGTIVIDPGLSNEETVVFTNDGAGPVLTLATPLLYVHAVDAYIILTVDVATPLTTNGGHFEDAAYTG